MVRHLQQYTAGHALASLVVLTGICSSFAVNYVYDESVWTKSKWENFKLEYPLQQFNPSDEATLPADVLGRLPEYPLNSLDGPFQRSQLSTIKEVTTTDQKLAEVLDDLDYVAPAAQAVQCTVCHALMGLTWTWLVEELHAGSEPSIAKTNQFMVEACEEELGNNVLTKYTIYKMDAESNGATMVFFVIRERKKATETTPTETVAVQTSCQSLVKELGGDLAEQLMESLALYKRELQRVISEHGISHASLVAESLAKPAQAAAAPNTDEDDDEYADDADDVEAVDDDCKDMHKECVSWADAGECQRNPGFMVGTGSEAGQCRKACGACKPKQAAAAAVDGLEAHPAAKAELEAASRALLQKLKNLGCGASTACLTGVSGMALGGGMVKVGPSLTQSAGFVLGKPNWGNPTIGKMGASHEARMPKPGSFVHPPASQAALAQKVHKVLHGELAGRVLSMPGPPDEFFIYEYVYQGYVYQYHTEHGKITEDWELGKFSEQLVRSKTGQQLLLDRLDLLPKQRMEKQKWPYVQQFYPNGAACDLAGGRRSKRSTEVRIACSPDNSLHMLIREPDFCKYIIVLYLPELCKVPEFKPFANVAKTED